MKLYTHLKSILLGLLISSLTHANDLDLPTAGMNLNGVASYSTQMPFNNFIKIGERWISRGINDNSWDDKRKIEIDILGYPKSLLKDQYAISPVFTHNEKHYPRSEYVLTWKGSGKVSVTGNGIQTMSSLKNKAVYAVDTLSTLGLLVKLEETDPNDPVQDIALSLPHSLKDPSPFTSIFKENLKPFGVIRFMGWDNVNSSNKENWSDRTLKGNVHQGKNGVAYEYMIELCNELQADMWVSIPHKATIDYQKQLAQLIKDNLDPKLRVWVEYSNEVWNFGGPYQQSKWLDNNNDVPGKNLPRKVAHKSAEVWNSFKSVFGHDTNNRIIRVAARQAGNPWTATEFLDEIQTMNFKDQADMPDVLAITHYFGGHADNIALEKNYHTLTDPTQIEAAKIDIFQQIKQEIEEKSGSKGIWTKYAQIAKQYNIPLVSYEGGPSLFATGKNVNNEELTQFLIDLNRDPRMGDCIKLALDAWTKIGGKTPVSLGDVALPSKWGSWGHKEYAKQPLGDPTQKKSAHKMRALFEWIDSQKAENPTHS